MALTQAGRGARLRWWPAGLAGTVWALTVLGVAGTLWLDRLLREAGRADLTALSASAVLLAVAALSAVAVGAVVATRRPRHPVGWLLLVMGLSIVVHEVTYSYTRYGLVVRPGALPGAAYLAGLNNGAVVQWIACAGFVLLLTPDGRLPSPGWRWWARIAAAAAGLWLLGSIVDPAPLRPEYPDIANPLGVPALFGPLDLLVFVALIVLVSLIVGAVSLLLRYRRARGVERLQLRWLIWGAVVASLALVVAIASLIVNDDFALLTVALGVSATMFPLATGAAILRYRLYDLDRIISRTVAYGLLTVLLGLGYAVVVLGLGRLLPEGSSLVVAAATLAVAAVFQPARRRVQELVDRRFNRRRYDAGQTIAAFSVRLRDQVDLDTLTAELLAVADRTVEPTTVSLWLRPPAERLSHPTR
jgi:MFS family permease